MSCLGPTNPSTPTHVTIKNVTDTSFTITWSPPLCTGGVKLQEYLLFYDEQVKEDESSVNIYPPKEVSFHGNNFEIFALYHVVTQISIHSWNLSMRW